MPGTCEGKRDYPDFDTAQRMARNTNRNRDAHTGPYRCPHCHRWHVGTSTTAERPRRR